MHSDSLPENSGTWYKSPAISLKWGACVSYKSKKIWTASEQYILNYIQKTSEGTPPLPPLVGIGLSKKGAWVKVYYTIAVFTDY